MGVRKSMEPGLLTSPAGRALQEDADGALLARVVRRDRQAFETLYHSYYPRLLRFILRVTSRHDIAEEIINDTMFVVWEKAASFAGRSQVSTWILGIAYRKALKVMKRQQPPADAFSPEGSELPGCVEPDADLEREQLRGAIDRGLRRLSPEQRMVVELTYYFGYSYPEIAKIAGCPENTVKTRMFHARRKLRKILKALVRAERRTDDMQVRP